MFCPSCGQQNHDANRFCIACGTKLEAPAAHSVQGGVDMPHMSEAKQNSSTTDDAYGSQLFPGGQVETEDIDVFVGNNADYFKRKWASGGNVSWNWAAFFLGIFWITYRKMYFVAFIVCVVTCLIAILMPGPGDGISLIIAAVLGVFGNIWYRGHVLRKIARIKEKYSNQSVQHEFMRREGGTSVVVSILSVVALVIVFSVVVSLTTPM